MDIFHHFYNYSRKYLSDKLIIKLCLAIYKPVCWYDITEEKKSVAMCEIAARSQIEVNFCCPACETLIKKTTPVRHWSGHLTPCDLFDCHDVAMGRSTSCVCAESDAARQWSILQLGVKRKHWSWTRGISGKRGRYGAVLNHKTRQRQLLLPQTTVHKHGKVSQIHQVPLWPVLNYRTRTKR